MVFYVELNFKMELNFNSEKKRQSDGICEKMS